MCGIAGCIGEHEGTIARMTQALVHRGPDGHATYVGHGVSLGHARLAILDPSPAANQPMWDNERQVVIVFNGEIFNYREIAKARGFTCRTGSDTEVLLHLFKADGANFLQSVRGMYALAIYDTRSRELWLARDPSGIKPLYTRVIGNEWYFASEVRSLLQASTSKPEINYDALSLYMHLQYIPRPHTLCVGISSVEPGTLIHIQNNTASVQKLTNIPTPWKAKSKADLMTNLPQYMQECVSEHLVSDKPVGIFLSGGMDSSILLHHMAQVVSTPIRTYTARFAATAAEGAARFNADADLARLTSQAYNTLHTEVLITAETYQQAFRACVGALDQPNSDHVSIAQYLLAQAAKPHTDVILTGAGGDELFGGYPRYRIAKILQSFQWVPPSLRRLAATIGGFPPDVSSSQPGPALWARLLGQPADAIHTFAKSWYQPNILQGHFEPYFTPQDAVRQAMEVDRHTWLIDESLKLTDGTTMASGVEARVPFLDQRLIGLVCNTPGDWHVNLRRTKTLLKDTYRPLLPPHLYTLPKASFYPPMAKWIRRETRPIIDQALAHPWIQELFDTNVLQKQFQDHIERRGYHLHSLFGIAVLAAWYDEVLAK